MTPRPPNACPVIHIFASKACEACPTKLQKELFWQLDVLNTKSTPTVEIRRAWLAADWAMRSAVLFAFQARNRSMEAKIILALKPIINTESASNAIGTTIKMRGEDIYDFASAAMVSAGVGDRVGASKHAVDVLRYTNEVIPSDSVYKTNLWTSARDLILAMRAVAT